MKVLHLLASGGVGGIEILMSDYAGYSGHENVFMFAWGGGKVADKMKKNGCRIVHLNVEKNGYLKTIITICKFCKRENIDAVISHNSSPLFRLAIIVINIRFPIIHTIVYAHSSGYDICDGSKRKELFFRKTIQHLAFNMSDHTIAVSEAVKKSLIGYLRVNKEKISVIYNGIDTTRFIPTNKRIGKKINIIYVGRLVKEKGVQNILEALKYLDDLPEYSLKIVGGGTYQETLETLTTKLELCEQVEFCGYRENIPELLQQADIFVHMPEWEEGFGISVVEAMASGKVCIVADCGAMPEIISDGIDGFLVPKGNVIALSETIRNVAEQINSAEMEQIRTNAVNKAKLFTIKNFANNLDAVIET